MSNVVMNTDWHTDNDIADPAELPIPCGFRMLIRPVAPVKKTQGGIILTDKSVEMSVMIKAKNRGAKLAIM